MSRSRPNERRTGDRVGPYQLVQPLGRGGMAEVWTARDSRLKPAPLVVIKRILPRFADEPEFVRMLRTEAQLMARLDHPNIVRLRDSGDDGGLPYLVLDLVDGLELARVTSKLRSLGPMPVAPAAYVARELALTLDYLHKLERGLVHRDVSPSNVILAFDGAIKLLDFGIAKALDSASDDVKTRTGVLKGKLGYLSPEQVDGHELDARSDQFSLGVVLHELCTGSRLFVGETAPLLLLQVRAAKVAPPSLSNAAVPPELDRVCLRALARARDERFADCGELAAALDPIVAQLGWDVPRQRELLAQLDLEPTISRSDVRVATPTVTARPRRRPAVPRRSWLLLALLLAALGGGITAALYWWRVQPLAAPPKLTPPTGEPRPEELSIPPLPPTAKTLPPREALPPPDNKAPPKANKAPLTDTKIPAQELSLPATQKKVPTEEKPAATETRGPAHDRATTRSPSPAPREQAKPPGPLHGDVVDPWNP